MNTDFPCAVAIGKSDLPVVRFQRHRGAVLNVVFPPVGTGGSVKSADGERETLYLRAEWEVPADGLSLTDAREALEALDLAYQFTVMLILPDYADANLSGEPFWLRDGPRLKPEHQLTFISAEVGSFVVSAAIPSAVAIAAGKVAVAIEKIVGLPWRLQTTKAKRDEARAKAEKASWDALKARAQAESAQLKLAERRSALQTQEAIQEKAKKLALKPARLSIESQRRAA